MGIILPPHILLKIGLGSGRCEQQTGLNRQRFFFAVLQEPVGKSVQKPQGSQTWAIPKPPRARSSNATRSGSVYENVHLLIKNDCLPSNYLWQIHLNNCQPGCNINKLLCSSLTDVSHLASLPLSNLLLSQLWAVHLRPCFALLFQLFFCVSTPVQRWYVLNRRQLSASIRVQFHLLSKLFFFFEVSFHVTTV